MPVAQPTDHQPSEFRYTFKSGDTLVLPPFAGLLTFGLARKLRKLPVEEQIFTLVENVCDDDELAVLDKMDTTEAAAFFEAWQQGAGVSLGESAGSST